MTLLLLLLGFVGIPAVIFFPWALQVSTRWLHVASLSYRSALRVCLLVLGLELIISLGVAAFRAPPLIGLFITMLGGLAYFVRRLAAISSAGRSRRAILYFAWKLTAAAITIAVVVPFRLFAAAPFEIRGEAMEPTLHSGELVLVNKMAYRFNKPQRGDVIVLVPPEPDKTTQYYVKRIIGLPSEKVELKNGKVMIYNGAHPSGMILDEPYISPEVSTEGGSSGPVLVTEGSYYVLGDNREHSNDSRYWGLLPQGNIVGRVGGRIWSLGAAR